MPFLPLFQVHHVPYSFGSINLSLVRSSSSLYTYHQQSNFKPYYDYQNQPKTQIPSVIQLLEEHSERALSKTKGVGP